MQKYNRAIFTFLAGVIGLATLFAVPPQGHERLWTGLAVTGILVLLAIAWKDS